MSNQPIIILGMHRSGTTMISKILENLGLFVGNKKEINNEALFFWEINNWIFDLHTARPELPHNMQYTNPETRVIIEDSLKYFVASSKKKQYLGSLNAKYNSIQDIDIPFGWKDPKNSFTIDFWKSVFPNPKIIHVYRNPIDSFSSYIERDLEIKNRFQWSWKKKLKRRFLITKDFNYNFRLFDLEQGYQLWQEYVFKSLQLKENYENYCAIKYETFLASPLEEIQKLIQFCELSPSEEQMQEEILTINTDRAYAFLRNEKYLDFYQKIKNDKLLVQLGYDKIL